MNGGPSLVPSNINSYIEALIPKRTSIIEEMEQYAYINHVPIMDLISAEAILQLLRIIKPKRILEIGAAIGYSSIRMAEALPSTEIVTIERHQERYDKALEFIAKAEKNKQIEILFGDALELVSTAIQKGPYDVIFIDAAKGQYKRFFQNYEPAIANGGVIITDNVLFKGLVVEDRIENRRRRQLVDKIRVYNEWLMSNPGYDTTIIPVGDGVAISKKRDV